MGRSESSFKRTYEKVVCQLSSVQMGEISCRLKSSTPRLGSKKSRRVLQVLEPSGSCQWVFDAFNEKKVLEDECVLILHLLDCLMQAWGLAVNFMQ